MAEKSFGIKELNIIGSSGTPQIQSVENLKIRVGVGSTVIIGDSNSDFTSPAQVDSNNTTVLNVGIVTANYFYGDGSNLTGVTDNINADSLYVSGISTFAGITTVSGATLFTKQLIVSTGSTFTGAIDANGDLDVDGHTELDDVNVSGVITAAQFSSGDDTTIGQDIVTRNLSVSGFSTYIGVATYKSHVYIDGTLTAGAIDGGTY